jgi:hypothetical protein
MIKTDYTNNMLNIQTKSSPAANPKLSLNIIMINSNAKMKGESISSKGIISIDNADSRGSKPQNKKTTDKTYPSYPIMRICTIGK